MNHPRTWAGLALYELCGLVAAIAWWNGLGYGWAFGWFGLWNLPIVILFAMTADDRPAPRPRPVETYDPSRVGE